MTEARRPSNAVLAIVVAYAVFGGAWILLSDRLLEAVVLDAEQLSRLGTYKGWVFVAVTSVLLYVMLRRMALALDAAHRRELEHARERQQPPPMLSAIAQASDDAIFAKDVHGRYVLFNDAAARTVGKPASEVLGQDDRAIFPAELAEQLIELDRRIRTTGVAETAEEVLQTPLGERVFNTRKGPLRTADGAVFGTYGIARDITSHIGEHRALRRLADELDATLQAIPDLMFEVDEQGRYLDVRASNAALLAAPVADLIGHTAHEVLPREAADTVMAALEAAGRTGSDYGRTIALDLGVGLRHFELSVARKPAGPDQPVRFLALSRDVTDRLAAVAELTRRNDELEHFNRMAVDRELRMVALKQEVNALARAAGRPAPYDLSFAEPPAAA